MTAPLDKGARVVASDLRVVHKRTPSHFVTAPLSKGANVGEASSFPQERGICTIYKSANGITLIALIVTIIVLLILAMTTVSLVLRENLIEKAQLAKDEYEQAAQDELTALNELENAINNIEGPVPPPPEESNLKLGIPYHLAGKSSMLVLTFYEDELKVENENDTFTGTYTIENDEINIIETDNPASGMQNVKLTAIKEQDNYILLFKLMSTDYLLAINENGLTYFSGEKYFNEDKNQYIILDENSTYRENIDDNTSGTTGMPPVFYREKYIGGKIYNMNGTATSEDPKTEFELDGYTYTRVTE